MPPESRWPGYCLVKPLKLSSGSETWLVRPIGPAEADESAASIVLHHRDIPLAPEEFGFSQPGLPHTLEVCEVATARDGGWFWTEPLVWPGALLIEWFRCSRTAGEWVTALTPVLECVAAANERGYVASPLALENLLVDADGRVRPRAMNFLKADSLRANLAAQAEILADLGFALSAGVQDSKSKHGALYALCAQIGSLGNPAGQSLSAHVQEQSTEVAKWLRSVARHMFETLGAEPLRLRAPESPTCPADDLGGAVETKAGIGRPILPTPATAGPAVQVNPFAADMPLRLGGIPAGDNASDPNPQSVNEDPHPVRSHPSATRVRAAFAAAYQRLTNGGFRALASKPRFVFLTLSGVATLALLYLTMPNNAPDSRVSASNALIANQGGAPPGPRPDSADLADLALGLLARRADCLAEANVDCLRSVVQEDSSLGRSDLDLIARGQARVTNGWLPDQLALAGTAGAVYLLRAQGDQPGVVIVVNGPNGLRLRDLVR